MKTGLRLAAVWEYLRGSLWPLPALFVLLALALGSALALVRPVDDPIPGLVFAGSASGARAVLSVIAGAMITVTSLTFSLTVVALQMASAQFSPRVMREFLADPGNQTVLGIFLATFAYCLAVIRVIHEGEGAGDDVVPRLAVTVGILLALLSVVALVYFIHHLTQQLRVDRIMRDLARVTLEAIDRAYPEPVEVAARLPELPPLPARTYRVRARRSGFLQSVTVEGLAKAAAQLDVVVQLRPRIGAQLPEGTTLAWVWPRQNRSVEGKRDEWDRLVHDHVHIGNERTMQQDVAFGIRQLVDIAVRAMSTGVNDPTTSVDVLGWLSIVIGRLMSRKLEISVQTDPAGAARAILPTPWLADYLDLACDQFRRYGAQEPQVVLALLELLLHTAEVAVDDRQRSAVDMECARTLEVSERHLDPTDMSRVRGAADLVRETLQAGGHPHHASGGR